MNTHDIEIELPPLPDWADSTLQGEDRDSLFTWASTAIEADRKRLNALDDVARSSRSVDQIKEALQDRSQRFVASYSEVMNLIRYYEAHLQRIAELEAALQSQDREDADLKEALLLALEYWADRQQRYKNRSPVWVQKARTTLGIDHAKYLP